MDFFSELTVNQYLSHAYQCAETPVLPMADEAYITLWRQCDVLAGEQGLLPALEVYFSLSLRMFPWRQPEAIKLSLVPTPVGHIPVLETEDKADFVYLAQVLSGRDKPLDLPESVNALAINGKRVPLVGHRILLLSQGGYCSLPAEELGVTEDIWLKKSRAIRLAHECSHYCTLRIFGGMKNHPMDELIADCMGQLAAFGCFRAELQRKFFGLDMYGNYSGGRLGYYCRLPEQEFAIVCQYVHQAIEAVATYLQQQPVLAAEKNRIKLLMVLATKGILPIAKGDFYQNCEKAASESENTKKNTTISNTNGLVL